MIGTVGTRIAGRDVKTALTTPEAPDLHALFAVMVEQGVSACAMEVSSHALVMGRVAGVVFDVAAFLNLGRDHLDFHKDVEDYFAAKASLFTPERTRRGLTNVDDAFGRRLLDEATVPMATFSPSGAAGRLAGRGRRRSSPRGSTLHRGHAAAGADPRAGAADRARSTSPTPCARSPWRARPGSTRGWWPTASPAAAGCPAGSSGSTRARTSSAIVDYAHKPDAVEAALAALRPLTAGRLVLVIGAGGDRDTGKRPVMGEIGARLADVLVVTDDNPRTEDPAAIRAALLAGRRGGRRRGEVLEIGDRRAAIRRAVDDGRRRATPS